MQNRAINLAAIAAAAVLSSRAVLAIPAFSGAEGPGANATGGRGGDVYHVTRLDFDLNGVIPGSLKYGINNAPAAGRTIVFDVGGTIFQNGGGANFWFRSGRDNITIAGQTAPGAGVTIAGVGSKFTGNNVILRNLTVRPNKDPVNPTSFTYDAFSLQLKNSIVDHVTATWYSDEGISLTDAGENTTVQYANINEGLNYNSHSFGSIISTEVDATRFAYHHNLYAHNNSRVPRLGSELGATGAVTSFSNNVVYNWVNKAGYSGTDQNSRNNFTGNYFIKGNNNGVTIFDGGDDATRPGYTQVFQNKNDPTLANKADHNKNGVIDGVIFGPGDTLPNGQKYYAGNTTWLTTPFAVPGMSLSESADLSLQRVLDYGGANWNNRNPIEQRVVDSVRTGTGAIINDLTAGAQAAEWATVMSQLPDAGGNAPFTRPANFDTDQDGLPDEWEIAHGLNPAAPSNNGDFDSDGYTNLEEYINELSEWPAPRPLVFSNALGNNRYAQIENWSIPWQPSRFDTAVISNGAAVVIDAVGQHAGSLTINAGGAATVSAGWLSVANRLQVAGGATLNVTGGQLFAGALALDGGGLARLANGANVTPHVGSVEASTGKLDLGDNGVVVDYSLSSPLASMQQLIASAYNGGVWDGNGITSNLADATQRGIGYAEASAALSISGTQTGTFRGQIVDATSVLVMYTLYGDTNLDGSVNIGDFANLAAAFNQPGDWSRGDADYNGSVNIADFSVLASQFNQSLAARPSAVPEPCCILAFAGCATLSRRKR